MASMVNCLVFCALFAAALSAETPSNDVPVVNVAVYFESYCPDSVGFLTKQLYPVFVTDLKKHLNITLVPYGKATRTLNATSQSYDFMCHHGQKECEGNKVIACALNEGQVSFEEQFKFINCTSSIIAKDVKRETYPVEDCAMMVPMINKDHVMSCSNGAEGSNLLAKYGDMTDALQNPLTSVPTVVFNGTLNADESMKAIKNFRAVLCEKISGTKPAACEKSAAGTLQAAILTLCATLALAIRV